MDTSLDLTKFITFADIIVFSLIIVLSIISISYGQSLRKKNSSETSHFLEHLLMGRQLTLPLFVATLVASWYGGIFGVTEIAFNHGIFNFLTQGIFWYLTYIIFALFIVDKISSFKAVTLPDLVTKMFGKKAGFIAAGFNFFNVLPVAYVLSLGLFLQMLLGWSLVASTILGTMIVCLYSLWGGMRADVFSDLIQFVVMCSAVFMLVVFAFFDFGGIGFLRANLPASHFDPLGGHSWAETLVWGFIAAATLVDPNFYQRCFAAQKPQVAKIGIFISTIIWCLFDISTTAGAMYARAVLPHASGSQGYMLFAMDILPAGLRGFFLAGIVAIIISTLDSFLIIASHTLSFDLMPSRFKEKVFVQRISTLLVAFIAIGLSFCFQGSVKETWKTLGSYSAGCLLIPMLLGYFRPGLIGEVSFVIGTLAGATGITLWKIIKPSGFWINVDELYIGLACTIIGLILGKVVDRFRVVLNPKF